MHLKQLGDNMTRKRRPNFSPEFKLESAGWLLTRITP
jgi:hypothetical protein